MAQIFLGVERIDELTDPQLDFLMFHECMHWLHVHTKRFWVMVNKGFFVETLKNLTSGKVGIDAIDMNEYSFWNICTDLEINSIAIEMIAKKNIFKAISYGAFPSTYNLPEKLSAEKYADLLKQQNGGKIPDMGEGEVHFFPADGFSEDVKDAVVTKVQRQVAEACKKAGIDTADYLETVTYQKVRYDWKALLKASTQTTASRKIYGFERKTYEKFNRKFAGLGSNVIIPKNFAESQSMRILVGIDNSGSMGNLTNVVMSYLMDLVKSVTAITSVKIAVDAVIVDVSIKMVLNDLKVNELPKTIPGKGGTDMPIVFDYARNRKKKDKIDYDLIIILTDGYTGWNHPEMSEKTLVLLTGPVSCPYKNAVVKI